MTIWADDVKNLDSILRLICIERASIILDCLRARDEPEVAMPQLAEVLIYYGPYLANGVVTHRTHRLEGLQEVLSRNGHLIAELIPTSDWNSLWLKVNGEIVFRCDIRDLDFGGDGLLDPLCHKALRAVNNAFWDDVNSAFYSCRDGTGWIGGIIMQIFFSRGSLDQDQFLPRRFLKTS